MTATPLDPYRAPAPLEPAAPLPPDADWATVRDRVMADLLGDAASAWTDHNASDPGVTLAEAAAFTVADLHYRVAEAGFGDWPLTWPGWLPDAARHWHVTLPAGRPADPAPPDDVTVLAAALQAAVEDLEPAVRECQSRADAEALLGSPAWTGLVPDHLEAGLVALLRTGLVRQVAQEQADVVADAVAEADLSGGPPSARQARAVAILATTIPLWDDELVALVQRERLRLSRDALARRRAELLAATTAAARAEVATALVNDGLTVAEAGVASALPRIPAALLPEDLEDPAGGETRVWPPHPVQALTCEPVTPGDYARRARCHPGIHRAWAVPGRLEGIAWHGLPAADPATLPAGDPGLVWAADPDAAAVTIVVEAVEQPADADRFLRRVLRSAVGTEVFEPFPTWREDPGTAPATWPYGSDLTDAQPRRVICDEVGVALLRTVPVVAQATLVVPVTAGLGAVAPQAADRLRAYFADGRPENQAAPPPADDVSGPWPPAPQPPAGWVPGEAVRFSEVVETLADSPDVLGVRGVYLKLAGDPAWTDASAGRLELPAGSVPTLDADGCLDLELATTQGCGDA